MDSVHLPCYGWLDNNGALSKFGSHSALGLLFQNGSLSAVGSLKYLGCLL